MPILLIIVSIGVIMYGYLLVDRIDRFMEHGGFTKEPEATTEKEILLYGEPDTINAIGNALDKAKISHDQTTETEMGNSKAYHWIGAFSRDDEDNLLICLSARRKNNSICTMAKCNNAIYKNVFVQAGITVILQNEVSIEQIIACLKG